MEADEKIRRRKGWSEQMDAKHMAVSPRQQPTLATVELTVYSGAVRLYSALHLIGGT